MSQSTDPSSFLSPEAWPKAVLVSESKARFQVVWILPLLAALIGGYLAVQAYLERGPVITIVFKSAEGLEPGKTRVKFKEVEIGQLTHVRLGKGNGHIVAQVQLVKEAENLLVEDARFWVVRPRVSGGTVSGLGTLLSGAYIGFDVGSSQTSRREFVGLETPPVVAMDVPGRTVHLVGRSLGSLDVGTPVYFRRVKVGQVLGYALSEDGSHVALTVFVQAPHDRFLNEDSRFWHASGIDFSLDASGFQINTQSLATLMAGGIAFDNPEGSPASEPPHEERVFVLFDQRTEAMKAPDRYGRDYRLYFNESIRGLSAGSPVEFRGLPIGEVLSVDVAENDPSGNLAMAVDIRLYPERLRGKHAREGGAQTEEAYRATLEALVKRGLRAQLRPASLVTGQLLIALDFFPNHPAHSRLDWTQTPPVLPTVGASLEELQASVLRIARKIDALPVEALLADVRGLMVRTDRLLQSSERLVSRMDEQLLEETRRTLASARALLEDEAPLQQDAREALHELSRTARALRTLADTLERHPEGLLRGNPASRAGAEAGN
jgi:paraquat-inducible protein B